MIPYKQLSLADIFSDCQNKFDNDKYAFLDLLDQTINLDEIVPNSFISHFHSLTGRPRTHLLFPMLRALLLQRIFSIPTDSLLILFLKFSQELRDFCGFLIVPDASKFTRFKQDFLPDLQSMFEQLVDLTEPICQKIDVNRASMTIFDTSGIEAWVTENNPKYLNSLIKQLKSFKCTRGLDDSYDPYKAAYSSIPPHACANPAIQQMYINGHFCYAYKFGIITNGLGIVRDITFYNKEFLKNHPDIAIEKKSDSPDEDKSLADSKALIPVLTDFFNKHPLIIPKTFLGDSAFDTIQIYCDLFHTLHFEKAFIPLNGRLSLEDSDCPLNEEGIPCCPKDPTLALKREGSKSHLRCGLPTMKFVCPKTKWEWNHVTKKSKRVCHCENPCTTSSCGRMFYIYPEKNLRAYPGSARGTEEWDSTYKIRVNIEKSINHFKNAFCVSGRKTRNEKTAHADLLLAGIAQLVTVIVADKIHKHQYIRSLRPLIS
ncbi:MAG: transposase [Hungatella sp.]|jgi:transposase|nr:transposase [Hungatella sp.]